MANSVAQYVLKEYGAWTVLIVSALVGLSVSRAFSWQVIPLFLGLVLFLNSRQAYLLWESTRSKRSSAVFMLQVLIAAGIFLILYGDGIVTLLQLLVVPFAYLVMRRFYGEHFLVTEMLGLMALSAAAVVVKYYFFGGIDVRLFVAVSFFVMAAAFKVKALVTAAAHYRALSLLYVCVALLAYRGMHIPPIVLLPLVDNIVAAITPYQVKLQTAGWIEVVKSIAFLVLMTVFY